MELSFLTYLTTNMANLYGIPVRIYEQKNLVFFYSPISFPHDPISLCLDEILSLTSSITYYTTSTFFYYGIINHDIYKIVIGPIRLIKPLDQELNQIALDLELSKPDAEVFKNSMKQLLPTSLNTVLITLCSLNFVLNHEQKNPAEILINEVEAKNLDNTFKQKNLNDLIDEKTQYTNNSYMIEKQLYQFVENGELEELKSWFKNFPAVHSGIMSSDFLRQMKNTFIAAATLVSRAAIRGSVEVEEALSLSDLYIQKMELLTSVADINSLSMNMLLDYTSRVSKIKGSNTISEFTISLNKYIITHLSDPIKSSDICKSLFISRSVLFDKVKKETKMTLTEYILDFKIKEAQKLIQYSTKSLAAISNYLGFSSQSHFNHAFKKISGLTPIEYRTKIKSL